MQKYIEKNTLYFLGWRWIEIQQLFMFLFKWNNKYIKYIKKYYSIGILRAETVQVSCYEDIQQLHIVSLLTRNVIIGGKCQFKLDLNTKTDNGTCNGILMDNFT